MPKQRTHYWMAMGAFMMGFVATTTLHAAEPQKETPLQEAQRLATEEARALSALAALSDQQGNYVRALPLYRRALAIQENAFGPDHPHVADALANLAKLLFRNAEAAQAEQLYDRALAIVEKSLGPHHAEVARYVTEMADVYANTGRHPRAFLFLHRALRINEKAFGPESTKYAESLVALGLLYEQMGHYTSAWSQLQRAQRIYETAMGPEHPHVARCIGHLGLLHERLGEYARAMAMYQNALAMLESALGPEHPDVAQQLSRLAALEDRILGERPSTEALYRRALSIQEKMLGSDSPDVAISLNRLAHLSMALGNDEAVEPLLQRAISIQKNTLGPEHPDIAISFDNLGHSYMNRGDYAKAESLFEQALAIRERMQGPEHPDVAQALHSLGILHWLMGDDTAESTLQKALDISGPKLGTNHPQRAAYQISMGRVLLDKLDKEDEARAESLFQDALLIEQAALAPDHPAIADTLNGLTMLHARQNRFGEAVKLATEASEMRDRHAATILATGTDEQKRLYMNTLLSQTSLDISLHVQHAPTRSDAARLAFTDILRRKGRVLDAVMAGVAAVRRSSDPADQALLEQLTSVYSQFANHVARGRGKMSPEQYRKELATLETNRKKLENEISKRRPAFQNLVMLSDVQAQIPLGAALVEIARYAPIPFRKSSLTNSPIAPRYVAYILYDQGDPVFVDLGEATPIEVAIDAFRVALSDHDLSHDPKLAARRLDELVMRPIRELLGHRRWVFLSLDGPLHLVPFAALLDERGDYLVERYLISYLTTGRELLRIGEKRRDSRESPLILANPAFFDGLAHRSRGAQQRGLRSVDMVKHPLPLLENTAEEAKTIARLFPRSRMLLGAEATEEAVKGAHGPSVLHLATHGFFLSEQPIPEALLRNVGPEPTPAERAALLRRENPLLRSGIALAGFNRRQSSGDDDGVLTALEAAALDLDGTRLVVLSTCESGLGQATTGEGVYGLRRALSIAGAETQVMSLWQVDTGRTQELMQAYYRRLHQGEGRSEAMRDVQLAMLSNPETTHPNLWASFIVSGDFRPLDGQVRLPEFGKVLPGTRGCTCALLDQERPSEGPFVALVLGGFVLARGRRRFGKKTCAVPRSCGLVGRG